MTDLAEIWEDMEKSLAVVGRGRLQRRLRPDSAVDLFAGLELPEGRRVIILGVSAETLSTLPAPASSKGVEVRVSTGTEGDGTLTLRLLDPRFAAIFLPLCTDLVEVAADEPNDLGAAEAFLSRWRRWQQFLQVVVDTRLSLQAQMGLLGELWFLSRYLIGGLGAAGAVSAWCGPAGGAQDFELPGVNVEVKCGSARRPQRFSVASEAQLDDTGVERLLLFHLSVDVRRSMGQTLPAVVEEVREKIGPDEVATIFEQLLSSAGYFDEHATDYQATGFEVRAERLFEVVPGFPRITDVDLPPGVSEVEYKVELTSCEAFAIEMASLDRYFTRWSDGGG